MTRHWTTCLLIALAACADSGSGPEEGSAAIRVLHTVVDVAAVDVLIDGAVVLEDVALGDLSAFAPVPEGVHAIAIRPAGTGGSPTTHDLTLGAGDSLTILTIDSGSVLNPWVLTDTGAVVPAGRSKLRALHFAAEAPPLDIWRTQPDWADPITFMFPHDYGEITPYMESDPGTWTVIVSSLRRTQQGIPVLEDTLLITGGIAVPAGGSRTVVVLDAPGGGLTFEVIDP